MIFSKACEYGIRATLYIAQQSIKGQRVSLKAIAREINSPEAFTAKVLQQLARKNLIISSKGPTGGFQIAEDKINQIKLMEIIEAIDGKEVFSRCGLGLKQCSESHPCPVHEEYKIFRGNLEKMFETNTLETIANGLNSKQIYLKR